MAWLAKWWPTIVRILSLILAAGGGANAAQMGAVDNYSLANYGITGGWFAAALAALAVPQYMANGDAETPAAESLPHTAASVKALRKQASALNTQADTITTALKAEAVEAEASK